MMHPSFFKKKLSEEIFKIFLLLGRHKCREEWPDVVSEKVYNLLLVCI